MPDLFQRLAAAILAADQATTKELIRQDPGLATASAKINRLEEGIPHWIYAGDTLLHIAAAAHQPAITRLLLDAGAEVGAARNHRSGQSIHYAADGCLDNPSWDAARQVRTLDVLLNAGADLQARDKNGATPLHRAVRTRCARAVQFLLQSGADPTARNNSGSTPFHLAVQNTGRGGSGAQTAKSAQAAIIRAFLQHGLSPALPDAHGKSVLDWARSGWILALINESDGPATDTPARTPGGGTSNKPKRKEKP